jgi:hypothetical protein
MKKDTFFEATRWVVVLALLLTFGTVLAACGGTNRNDFVVEPYGFGAIILGYTGTAAKVVIPAEGFREKGYPVVKIGDGAFAECNSLVSVVIPKSVTSIGKQAFRDCSNLTTVNIPKGVTEIDAGAFTDCISLTSITIPNSVTSIGKQTFRGCISLTSITVEDGAKIEFDGIRIFESTSLDLKSQVALKKAGYTEDF